jgi:hypothetical protein
MPDIEICDVVKAAVRSSQQAEVLVARCHCITRNFRRISGLRSRSAHDRLAGRAGLSGT